MILYEFEINNVENNLHFLKLLNKKSKKEQHFFDNI